MASPPIKPQSIAVITVCKDAEKHIKRSIQSVLEQTDPPDEYIVVDGQSTDRTPGILNSYSKFFSHCLSESDSGISEAMNKGIQLSSSEYLLFLHADDFLKHPDVLKAVRQILKSRPDYDIYALPIEYELNNSLQLRTSHYSFLRPFLKPFIQHQGAFISRHLFDKYGLYDEQLKVSMDYDFFRRVFSESRIYTSYSPVVSVMSSEGISSRTDRESLLARFSEEKAIHLKHIDSFWAKMLYKVYWSIYPLYRLGIGASLRGSTN